MTPWEWSDLWMSEGHVSWYEFVFAEERGQLEVDTEFWRDPTGYPTVVELMRAIYAHGDEWRAEFGPVARPHTGELDNLFSFQAYHGGALVLFALRQKIGPAAFAKVERTWVERYRNRSVRTVDFIAHAAQVSGRRDVAPFLHEWLYGTKTSPMPGHPDWRTNPVQPQTRAAVPPRARRR